MKSINTPIFRSALFVATALAPVMAAQTAFAQASGQGAPAQAAPEPQVATVPAQDDATQDIVVTGIRASLASATNAKKDAVAFGDSIFAEDIGKLPATNLAETLNRMPGVRLNRDISGEGTQVSIRGLGPSFSKVLLNGSQIQVASDGGTNGGSANREVDLDFFPSELFTRLDLAKTPSPSTIEGGIAGTINLRNARPFDKPGTHITVVGQGQYTDANKKISPRGAIVASHTFGDTFGILLGVAGVKTKTRVDGFESVGWTDGNLGAGDPGGNNFSWASIVPANAGNGLVSGQPVDVVATSGLTRAQLGTALIPRLGRNSLTDGDRSRISALASVEWRPSDTLHFAIDGIWAKSKRDYSKFNMNWQVRNSGPGTTPQSTGGMIPIGLTIDENNVVTSGTFANSSFFLEASLFNQTTKFWNINPSVTWQPSETVKIDAQVNYSKSSFFREQPTFAFQTPPNSGVTVFYDNNGKAEQPLITTNIDLNNPNYGWQWYRQNIALVRRKTETKGAHVDGTFGDDFFNVKIGAAYDRAQRTIRAYDNSPAYQLSVCGVNCTGATGSVPTSAIPQYLRQFPVSNFGHLASGGVGYTGFIVPDFDALKQATNYASFRDSAPEVRGAVTGGATGDMDEKVWGAYFELNGVTTIADRELRINAGMRYAHTDQLVVGPSQVGTTIVDITSRSKYENFLPSINLTYDLLDNLKLRASASRTMTRPDAGQILPGITFSDPSALLASAGNPDLQPFTSDNYDVGGEFYTGGIGYVGVSLFMKNIQGFTVTQSQQATFGSLNIPFDTLISTQQNALRDRSTITGTPINDLLITVNRPINLSDLKIKGIEATWVQPLDFLVKGLGFSANGTYLKQSSSSGLVATGVSPYSYNLQGFYEDHGLSISVNYVWNDKSIAVNKPQNGINDASLRSDARGQLDTSIGYQLPFMNKAFRLTLDMLNLTNEPIRTTFEYDNAAYSVYYPGRTILAGVRANF
jgi:TonB-dependent receptor